MGVGEQRERESTSSTHSLRLIFPMKANTLALTRETIPLAAETLAGFVLFCFLTQVLVKTRP